MRGVILAGGTGSRLSPLTNVINKHLLPVGAEPMIYHPIRKLIGAGIKKILVVTGKEHAGSIIEQLGSGRYVPFSCDFTYKVQDEALGIADALRLAEDFTRGEPFCVILGDNIFQTSLRDIMSQYKGKGAMIVLKEVPDPQRYGVAIIENNKIKKIVEKPMVPPSNFAVTGIYFYDADVFRIIDTLVPSFRGEYEITDVNNAYLDRGLLDYCVMRGWWTDAGTHSSYRRACEQITLTSNTSQMVEF